MNSIKTKKLGKQAVAEMLATVCRGKGCPATYELGCPFKNGEGDSIPCGLVDTHLWLAAMEEAKPEFKFGDKVRIAGKECGTLKGCFAFSESEDGGWFMVEGYRVLVFTKFKYVKAGWE